MLSYSKVVVDPIHGLIGLTEVESKILSSKSMQRLHNVKQLGLAHLVYPGANYSRHSHSLGACHNAGRMLDAINRNSIGAASDEATVQKYRLVALLHDVGHYPFSHATEEVVKEHYAFKRNANSIISEQGAPKDSMQDRTSSGPNFLKHEPLGGFIISNDPEIVEILTSYDIDPIELSDIFLKKRTDYPLTGIFSSDLDCDRLDYLRRTAHYSGAPFGSVDINFLIDQATTDKNGVFCFKAKAARAADHLLVSRLFDYMQVPFNKMAVALEWSLVCSLRSLFEKTSLDCSKANICKMVQNGDWSKFDDQAVISAFRDFLKDAQTNAIEADHLNAILYRRPAKLVASFDHVRDYDQDKTHHEDSQTLENLVNDFCRAEGVDRKRVFLWSNPIGITKYNPKSFNDKENPEYYAEAIQVLDRETNEAKRLFLREDLLLSKLCGVFLSGLRLYYLPRVLDDDGEAVPRQLRSFLSGKFRAATYV